MTKKAFKYAMQRGLGRCITELKNTDDIEKYRDIVMWGCRNELAYDSQCEGYRSLYLYEMICMFPDTMPFIEVLEKGLYRSCGKDEWIFVRNCETLLYFAQDGNEYVKELFKHFYDYLYNSLLKKRKWDTAWLEARNFEFMSTLFIEHTRDTHSCIRLYHKIVHDVGRLIRSNNVYSELYFEWFQDAAEIRIGKDKINRMLGQYSDKSDDAQAYANMIQEISDDRNKYQKQREKVKVITADELRKMLAEGKRVRREIPITLIRTMYNSGNTSEVEKLARYYESEQNENIRAQLLDLFSSSECSDLLNVDKVIEDSASENEELSQCAFWVLMEMRNEKVHDTALELLRDEKHRISAAVMLANNYLDQDCELFVKLVRSIPIISDENEWHTVFYKAIAMFEDKRSKKMPKELLIYMYEHGLCSCCRERIVIQMGRRRMLTDEIVQECLHDSNDKIRTYAIKKMRSTC